MKKFRLQLLIARKYLFARKSYAIINIISAISIIGVAVGTMALFVVLSVFNGFEELILNLFNNFHADYKIEAVEGKTFNLSDFPEEELRSIEGLHTLTYIIEDMALARYDNQQQLVTVKSVSDEFLFSARLDSMIVRGDAVLKYGGINYTILGAGVDYNLGVNLNDYTKPVTLYVPKRTAKASSAPGTAFVSESVYPSAVFSVQQEFDESYIFIPLEVAKELYEYDDELTSVEIVMYDGVGMKQTKKKIQQILGSSFVVKDRFQQQEFIYKVLRSEKLAIFLILSFILIIATFNVIGTLSMIILEKKKDISVLHAMGAPLSFLRKLFVTEGMLVVTIGAVIGIVLGIVLCFLQQKYSLLSLGNDESGFVVSAYPVKMVATDILVILATVGVIGFLSSLIPSRKIQKGFTNLNDQNTI